MKRKILFAMVGIMLAITQSFATSTPTVYTDETAFKTALGSSYFLDEFDDMKEGTMKDSLDRSSGEYEYTVKDELGRTDGLYEYTGILSSNFKGGATADDPDTFLITNKGKSINAFGGYFYMTDISENFVSGKEITVTVGAYKYTYTPTSATSFIGFSFPDTMDTIKITGALNLYNTMDHFYVGNNLSSKYQSGAAITSHKDNTIIQTTAGGLGNSKGLIYVGNIATADTITRRGLVQFDLSSVPDNVTIDSVKLVMPLQTSANMTIEMYKVTSDWGEGTSYSAGGMGAAATANDVTWLHSFYNGTFWTNPGGDYDATLVDSKTITSSDASMTMSSDEMKANVAAWVKDASTNYGWLLKSTNETAAAKGVIAKFYSKETAVTDAQKPSLYVYYSTSVTSIAKVTDSELMVYPVPTKDYLNVKTTDKISSINILDLTGKTVMKSGTATTLNLGSLIKGMYLIRINTANGTVTKQIIKE